MGKNTTPTNRLKVVETDELVRALTDVELATLQAQRAIVERAGQEAAQARAQFTALQGRFNEARDAYVGQLRLLGSGDDVYPDFETGELRRKTGD